MAFDVGIIGCGVAGTFAALKIAEKHKNCKCVVFEIGRPPQKRRRQLEGFLGCFPTGNGQIYMNDLEQLLDLTDGRRVTPAFKWAMKYFKEVNPMKLIKSSKLSASMLHKIENAGFDAELNDYYQWKPESVHKLSKLASGIFEESPNIHFCFDTEITSIRKNRKWFMLSHKQGDTACRRIILCVGRSGWRWVTNLYKQLGIVAEDDYAEYGVRVEIPSCHLRPFNKSPCRLVSEDLEVGPLNWFGTIIPEDHSDLVISAFRSNEDRWRSEKVSFSVLKSIYIKNGGCAQSDRMGKLSFLLFNDRVSKEKISTFMKNNSLLNLLPEYSWLKDDLDNLENIIPGLCSKGYMYVPHIAPIAASVRLGDNLESEINGMYIAGESAGIRGILGATVSGIIAANSACR